MPFAHADSIQPSLLNLFRLVGLRWAPNLLPVVWPRSWVKVCTGHLSAVIEADLPPDAELGIKMMNVALKGLKSFTQGFEFGETALKAIKMVKLAGEVIAAIAIVLDGILAIVAAVEGDKQRTKLKE